MSELERFNRLNPQERGIVFPQLILGSLVAQLVKNLPAVQDLGSIPGLGRSPGEEKGYPPQYSGLENRMDCIVHGVAKSQTRLSDFHFHFQLSHANAFFLFFGRAACGILVPGPGIESLSTAAEAQSLNHWTTREVP